MQTYPYVETSDLEPAGAAAHVRNLCYVNKNEIALQGDFLATITYDRKPNQVHPTFTLKSGNTLLYEWRGGGSWRGFGLPIMGAIVTLTVAPVPANVMVGIRNVPEVDRKLFFAGCRYRISPDVYWTVHGGNHLATDTHALCQGNFQNVYETRCTDQTVRDLTPGETSALRNGLAVPPGGRIGADYAAIVTTVGSEIPIDEYLRPVRDHNRLPPWRPHVIRTRVVSSGADSFQYHIEAVAALRSKYSPAAAAALADADAAVQARVEAGRAERIERAIGPEAAELFAAACSGAAPAPAPPRPAATEARIMQPLLGRSVAAAAPVSAAAPARLPARRVVILPRADAEPAATNVQSIAVTRRGGRAPLRLLN